MIRLTDLRGTLPRLAVPTGTGTTTPLTLRSTTE